ncbi:MAG: hypothetical protein H0T77_12950 [Pyrinomonadaceae bacterium]|nr:hypothetical protein [Pyrinomonadaceae bacterium]
MKTRNTFKNALALVALAAGLAVIIAAWQTRRVQAVQDSEDFPSDFGFIELVAAQTARLNVVIGNPDELPGKPPPARRVRLAFDVYVQDEEYIPNCGGIVPVPPCLIRYRFLRRESREVELMPGQAASFDFLASAVTKINASVQFLSGPDTRPGDNRRTPEPHLAPTLEVLEGARTIFVVPAVVKGFNPQPDPPGQEQ